MCWWWGGGSLTVHTAGVKYFQHSLKSSRGLWPVISLMLALKRSAPVGENDFTMSGCGWFDIMLLLRTGLLLSVVVAVAWFGGNVFFSFCFCQYPPLKRKLLRKLLLLCHCFLLSSSRSSDDRTWK